MALLNRYSRIAACGINCSVCMAYLREKNKCPGCRLLKSDMPVSIARCKIRNCGNLKKGNFKYCYSCKDFPCANLKHLDKRYKTRYNVSVIGNLVNIKDKGIKKFIRNEKMVWTCTECGGTICMHKGYCFSCGKKK